MLMTHHSRPSCSQTIKRVTNDHALTMHCLIRCVQISESVRQEFNKWLFGSTKLKTMCSRPLGKTLHSFAFNTEKKFLKKDKLTPDYELIYRLQTQRWWVFATFGSYLMAVIPPVILIYPFIFQSRRYYKPVNPEDMMENVFKNVFASNPKESVVFTFFAVAFNAFLFIITRRYVLRIYFNGEKYVAVYMNGFFPLWTKNHYFERGRRTKSLLFFMPDSNYRLGNRNGRLIIGNFRRPFDFENMLVTPHYEEEEEN